MGYHIDTALIYDKFKVDCECPLCEIRRVAEKQFVYEFLNDAVMEENTRAMVNQKGFCKEHFSMLFKSQNKLSLALQLSTHFSENLLANIKGIENKKQAKKQVEYLSQTIDSCVICDLLEESMKRYYKTVAQLYSKEKQFTVLFNNSKGFCLEHYQMLLKYSNSAGLSQKTYIKALSKVMTDNLNRIYKEILTFCDSFDYRNAFKPLGTAETAVLRTGIKLYGKTPE